MTKRERVEGREGSKEGGREGQPLSFKLLSSVNGADVEESLE